MSKLYLIPTPIGNLQDITLRAIDILKSVSLILAEDTRKSSILLKHYDISTPMRAFHKFNEHKTLNRFIRELKDGRSIGLITDAGSPGISDPGYLIVNECIQQDIPVEILPGATAFIPALLNSGLPADRFVFEGFLPQKKGRNKRLRELTEEKRTIVFYESPYRLVKTLKSFVELFGENRRASVSRELTKIHEETRRGTVGELLGYFTEKGVKGEIVIIVAGKN